MAARATQERTLGAILGLGIGDALGMPVIGRTPQEIAAEFGAIDDYHGRTFPDGAELAPGEFTDETEIALCIMETYTSANGDLDPELIRARMRFLARDESRRWMSAETLRSLDDEAEPWYCSPASDDPEVALRGIAIGLIHAAPLIDQAAIYRDVETVVALTHCSRAAVDQAAFVALAVARTLSGASSAHSLLPDLLPRVVDPLLADAIERAITSLEETADLDAFMAATESGNRAIDTIVSAIAAFSRAPRFEDAVFAAASAGGASDSRAALAGALAGAAFGAGGIPQHLIDRLEGRIYLTLAAPWFYRTVQLMTGRGISMASNGR
jgi:ADP-ribosyl-[dinitrogen reductase] hydrolase